MNIMVNKLHHHIKKHSRNLHWGLFLALIVSGSLLTYIGYFDKVLFPKNPAKESNQVALYYHKSAFGTVVCDNLYPTYRTIPIDQKNADNILAALVAGPTAKEKQNGYISIYSSETQSIIQSVLVKDNTAHVNFYDIRKIFPKNAKCLQESIVKPIEKSLHANLGINKVLFAINNSSTDFYNWIGISCSIINDDCYRSKFIAKSPEATLKTITSVSGKVQFNLPQNWYAQLDGYTLVEEKYSNIITATRIVNWNELETKAAPDNGVEMTIIELPQSTTTIDDLINCKQVNTCTTDIKNNIEIRKNTVQKERGLFEFYSFTKDNVIYVIEIQFPYDNTANREYNVTQGIINDLIIHI